MKILHLIFSEQIAGAEKYLLDLLPGLKDEGFDCHLLCVCPTEAKHKFAGYCEELKSKGVKATLFTGKVSGFLSVARKINQYLIENNIAHLHSHLFKSDLLAVTVKKLFNKKLFLISTKHGYQEKYLTTYPVHKGKIIRNAYYYIAKYLSHNINEQLTVSKVMSDIYFNLKITPQRMKYIYHGINLSSLPVATDTIQYRIGSPQLIIVGRIEEVKGHQYLFEAMPAVIQKYPDVKLLVLGNGMLKQKLIDMVKAAGMEKNILFFGFQQDPYSYMAQSDIIVLPSMFESFGLVYIESFALKVTVIGFDAPACNEIIVNNETGILVPMFSSDSLAEKIICLLQDPAERKRMAENGYAKYTSYYNTERMIKETADWYRYVLSIK